MILKKARRAADKASEGVKIGRPTKYRPEYAGQARKLALLGFTDAQLADFFQVTEQTVNNWKKDHPDFFESICDGKVRADANVASSLYQTALGGGIVTETREEPDAEGNVIRKRVMRELAPDVRAQRYWLGNRQPKLWRDKVVLEDEAKPDKLLDTANAFVEIMAKARERQRAILLERGLESDTQ